jgi:ATP-dependent Zn protease
MTRHAAKVSDRSLSRFELQRVAYHEAGHAFMCTAVKIRFSGVTIIPEVVKEGIRGGRVIIPPMRAQEAPHLVNEVWIMRHAMMYAAGPAAEQRAFGRSDKWASGWRADRERIDRLARIVCGGPVEGARFVEWMKARADNFIRVNWLAVEAIAKALLAKETLSSRRVRAICNEVEATAAAAEKASRRKKASKPGSRRKAASRAAARGSW